MKCTKHFLVKFIYVLIPDRETNECFGYLEKTTETDNFPVGYCTETANSAMLAPLWGKTRNFRVSLVPRIGTSSH